jgi:hypothetical protein
MANIKSFLLKLHDNLNFLREREARYGGEAPLALVNQIHDHQQAIALTEQAINGEIGEAEWQAALQPLLLGNDHWAGVSLATMLVLSRYAPDKGGELSQQFGSQATALAAEIFDLVLEKVKAIDARTAQRYPQNPTGYDAPFSDVLAELLEANQILTSQLKALLAQFQETANFDQTTGPQATITGSGVISQHSTLTAGDRGVAGSSTGGSIITGDNNVVENNRE